MAKLQQFNEKERDVIFKQAMNFWDESTEMMRSLFEFVDDAERMSRAQLPEELETIFKELPDRAALAPADFYINIKFIRSALRQLLFSKKPYGTLSIPGRPNIRDDNISKAEWTLQSMLDVQSDNKGFEYEADLAFNQALYAGFTAVFTQWVQRRERVAVRDTKTHELVIDETGRVVFKEEVVASYAETKSIDIRRVRIDPSAEKVKDIRLVGYHYIQSVSELIKLKNQEDSEYDFKEEELFESSFDRLDYYEFISSEAEANSNKGDSDSAFGDKIAEVKEIRGYFRFMKKNRTYEVKDLIVRYANNNVLLSIRENNLPIPGWELWDFPTVDKDLARMFPMGIVEPLMDTWIEKFIKRNQSLDEATRRTYDTYIGDRAACQDLPDVIPFEPNQIIKVNALGVGLPSANAALSPLERPKTGQDTFLQSASLTDDIQKGQGLNAFIQGQDPSRQETATAVTELVSGGQSVLVQVANNLKDTYLAPAWRKQLILWNFFKGHKENVITDEQGRKLNINPNEFSMLYRVDIDIATQADAPGMIRRFVELIPLLKEDPLIDQYGLTDTILETLKLPNPSKLLKPNEYEQILLDRENLGLMSGVPAEQMRVHPLDNDQRHIESHLEAIEFAKQPEYVQQGATTKELEKHIVDHQNSAQQKNRGLANTKELGGGAGDLNNAQAGAIKQKTGFVGAGLARENR